MKKLIWILAITALLACSKDKNPAEPQEEEPQWQLVWADEFNVDGMPDANNWQFETGGNGFGNNEAQYYTDARAKNCRVKDGNLVIEAHKEAYQSNSYTSAKIVTRDKAAWQYGKIKIRAKLPAGRGTWPAIWMLPQEWNYGNGGWPENGEIDIMEHVGYDQNFVHGTIHTGAYNHTIGTQKGGTIFIPDASSAFHDYTIDWNADKIDFYVDDELYFTFENDKAGDYMTWPYDRPFYLILNVAIGGNWGGAQGINDSIFPVQLVIDYVRVYQFK